MQNIHLFFMISFILYFLLYLLCNYPLFFISNFYVKYHNARIDINEFNGGVYDSYLQHYTRFMESGNLFNLMNIKIFEFY